MVICNVTLKVLGEKIDMQPSTSQSQNQASVSELSITKIFIMCISLYGTIGTLWFIFSRLSTKMKSFDLFRIGLNCISYMAFAITMHTLNKTLATTLKQPSLVSISQLFVGLVYFGVVNGKQLMECEGKALLYWCIIPLTFGMMLVTSLYTYQYTSLSCYTVMRNLLPILVLPAEMAFMPSEKKPKTNAMMIGSMLVMLAGAVLYAGSLEVSAIGVTFAIINMSIAATDRLIQRHLLTNQCAKIPTGVLQIMSNGLAIVPSLIVAGSTKEISAALSPEMAARWTDPMVLMLLLISGFGGMGVGFFSLRCQRDTSATSVFVLQNAAKVGVIIMGITMFGDPIKSFGASLGLLMSIGGSLLYSLMALKESEKGRDEKKAS